MLFAPIGTPADHSEWIDRTKPGQSTAITTINPAFIVEGCAPVKTLGDLLNAYRIHPESKAFGPDGKICGPRTRGLLLQPRQITTAQTIQCGKEANRYNDTTSTLRPDAGHQITEYPKPLCTTCGTEIDHRNGRQFCNDTCRKRHARARLLLDN